jgi:hypothetical protein
MVKDIDFAFIEIDFYKVMEREKNLPPAKCLPRPSQLATDEASLDIYVRKHDSLKPFSLSEALQLLKSEHPEESPALDFGKQLEEKAFPRILKARNAATEMKNAKSRFTNCKRLIDRAPSMTEYLYHQSRDWIIITGMNMPPEEWRDLFQVVVPVAYSDFVLLDARWTTFLNQAGADYPRIAKAYCKKDVAAFLADLEAFSTVDKV